MSGKRILRIARLPLLATLGACAGLASEPLSPPPGWQSPLRVEHPLVGRLWESATGRFVERAELDSRLRDSSFILLGEKHDNPDHHALQLMLLTEMNEAGMLAGVSLEMLDSTATPRLRTLDSRGFEDPLSLAGYLEWDSEGWDWGLYGELVWSAYRARLPLFAGNISRAEMSALYVQPEPVAAGAIAADARALLRADIDASHCGMLPESQLDAMGKVQQGRDLAMARSLLARADDAEAGGGQRVLIAGNYHVRQDIGVPNYLLLEDPTLSRAKITSLGFLEVAAGEFSPQDYLDSSLPIPSYDYLWFTPAVSDRDYCAGLRGEAEGDSAGGGSDE